jgi:hypothetical protein
MLRLEKRSIIIFCSLLQSIFDFREIMNIKLVLRILIHAFSVSLSGIFSISLLLVRDSLVFDYSHAAIFLFLLILLGSISLEEMPNIKSQQDVKKKSKQVKYRKVLLSSFYIFQFTSGIVLYSDTRIVPLCVCVWLIAYILHMYYFTILFVQSAPRSYREV